MVWVVTPLMRPAPVVTSPGPLVVVPAVTPRIVSVIVQVAFAATSTPEAVKGCVALAAVNVGAPQFIEVGAGGLAMLMPEVRVSVKFWPVRATLPAAVLAIVKVSVVVPFTATFAAPKAFVKVGRDCTVKFAVFEAGPVAAWVDETPEVMFG